MTPIVIPDDVRAAIYAHARAAFPDECCGYLVGAAPDRVDAAIACRNAQGDGSHPIAPARGADTGFVIAGDELFRFARSFDGDRPPRVIYHSHPNGRAYFSTVDRAMAAGPAYPVQHVVIGVSVGDSGGAPATDPAGDPASPSITEVAQFAWSQAAQDHVEIARWAVGPAGDLPVPLAEPREPVPRRRASPDDEVVP
jgi:proteasome lid subunit RPN8/RPN11